VFVLAAALSVDRQARAREGAILKAIGATRAVLIGAAAREYALLGAAAAIVGSILGALSAYAVIAGLFGFDFVFPLAPFLSALLAGPLLTAFLGLLGTWRTLGARPAHTLREL
jgi:putative ABC transport system permease protein